MEEHTDLKLTKELAELLNRFSDEDISYYDNLIKQTDCAVVNYQSGTFITEDGSDGKSK